MRQVKLTWHQSSGEALGRWAMVVRARESVIGSEPRRRLAGRRTRRAGRRRREKRAHTQRCDKQQGRQ